MVDVFGVGVEAAGGADAALELDEGVEGGEVDGAAAAQGGWVFFDDVLGFYEAGDGEEVTDGGGDVGLGLAFVVASQDFGCGGFAVGVVGVDVEGHWVMKAVLVGVCQQGGGVWIRAQRPTVGTGSSPASRCWW